MELLYKFDKQIIDLVRSEFGDLSLDSVSLRLGLPQKTLNRLVRKNKKKVFFESYCEVFDLFYYELVIEKEGFIYSGKHSDMYSAIFNDYPDIFSYHEKNYILRKVIDNGEKLSFKLCVESLYRNGFDIKFVKCVDN